ncbi:MAG: hypothetical protein KAR15_15960, partial [Desulfobacterales bacterium]|nr:hypothetical protein [Desulfobacterales bacterium]
MNLKTVIRTFGFILLMTAMTWSLGVAADDSDSGSNDGASRADEAQSNEDQPDSEEPVDTAEDGEVVGVSESLDSQSD